MNQESVHHLKESAIDVGAMGLGIVVGNMGMKLIKKDTMPVHIGIAAAGILGSTMVKNKHLQMGMLGLALYGALKVASHAVAPAVSSSTIPMLGVDEMSGLLPESLKAKIRGFLPSIGSIEDEEIFKQMKGSEYEDLHGDYADLTGDDDLHGNEDMGAVNTSYEDVSGFGDSGVML